MCNYYISWKDAEARLNTPEAEIRNTINYEISTLGDFADEGLLTFNDNEIVVLDQGKYFVRNIAASFDPGMKNATQKFSKAL